MKRFSDTSATIHPTPGLKGPTAAASWRGDQKTLDTAHLLLLAGGEQLGLLLYMRRWTV